MERPPFSRDWVAAEFHRAGLPTDLKPAQPTAPDGATSQPVTQSRCSRFSDFLEKLLEAIADSSVQPAGLGPRGFRGRFH